jgi:transcriptional regulator with XRE-family HTH domain
MTRDETSFPQRLKTLLAERGETAASLARVIDVTPQAVGKWLRGGDISFDTLIKLARHLCVNWVWLRYGQAALDELQKEKEKVEGAGSLSLDFLRREYLTEVMESERRHQKIFRLMEMGIWEENPITGMGWWSPVTRRLLGAPLELEATHENFRALMLEEDKPAVDTLHSSILLGTENRAIFRFRVTASPTTILYAHTVVERDDAGRPINLAGFLWKDLAC